MMMVIFHFIWDLNFFGHISTPIPNGPFWREFRALIVSLFLFSMGISLVIVYKQGINYKKLGWRVGKLVLAAGVITITTMIMMPNSWVYFGILHFIAFASVVLVGLVNYPRISLLLSGVVLLVYYFVAGSGKWPFNYIDHLLPNHTVDLATPFPWLALPLLGIWAAHQSLFQTPKKQKHTPHKAVLLLSKNSLIIYLIHQPIMFGSMQVLDWMSK